jgi:hypothetical protein
VGIGIRCFERGWASFAAWLQRRQDFQKRCVAHPIIIIHARIKDRRHHCTTRVMTTMAQPTTLMGDSNTSLSAIQKVDWGGRNLVRWDQFPKSTKIEEYHCNTWLGLDRQATPKELEETRLTLTMLKSRLSREITQEIKKHYVEHLKLYLPSVEGREIAILSWQKVRDIYASSLGTYELHHAYCKVMYQSWAYPTDLETAIQEAVKKAAGWEYTTIVDDKRRGFIRIIITEVKGSIHKQLRSARNFF